MKTKHLIVLVLGICVVFVYAINPIIQWAIFPVLGLDNLEEQLSAYPADCKEDDDNCHWDDLVNVSDDLREQGYEVNTAVANANILHEWGNASRNVLVIAGVEHGFSTTEASTIENFVYDGGIVFLADDGNNANLVSERFGISFFGERLLDQQYFDNISIVYSRGIVGDTGCDIRLDDYADNCLSNEGVHDYLFFNGPTGLRLDLSTESNPAIKDVQVWAMSSSRSAIDIDGNKELNIGDIPGPVPLIVHIAVQEDEDGPIGHIVFIADPAFFIDDFFAASEKVSDDGFTRLNVRNKRWFNTALEYLIPPDVEKGDIHVIFDESRHHQGAFASQIYGTMGLMITATTQFPLRWLILANGLVLMLMVIFVIEDKESWKHVFDLTKFTDRPNTPNSQKEQLNRVRDAILTKLRLLYSYSREQVNAMPPGRIADLIRNPLLSEVLFNQSRSWSKDELRDIIMQVRRWGAKDDENV